MNLDFHYYGTYMAACDAGFSEDEALKIAEAAQMVDDCTKSFLNEKKIDDTNRVITCESIWETVGYIGEDLSDYSSQKVKQIRKIWMPFHFLPGNLDHHLPYYGNKTYQKNQFDNGKDDLDFRCICLHNSPLVKEMIDNTKKVYNDKDSSEKKLSLIGIRMHVLADTWAHEYFAGTPSFWINNAEQFKVLKGNVPILDCMGTLSGSCTHSISYLGHGRAGHYPDFGYLSYRYHPQWEGDTKYIEKNNPNLFCCAYMQMVDAMKYIRQATDTFVLENDKILKNKFEQLRNASDISKVILTEKSDQSSEWRNITDMAPYDKYEVDMKSFQEYAKIHLDFVEYALNENDIVF